MLTDFYDEGIRQHSLFVDETGIPPVPALMAVMDEINLLHCRNSIYFAAKGMQQHWSMKRNMLSPAYITKWSDLIKAKP